MFKWPSIHLSDYRILQNVALATLAPLYYSVFETIIKYWKVPPLGVYVQLVYKYGPKILSPLWESEAGQLA